MIKRGSGILLHITSLPAADSIGNIGPGACGFVDFLAEAGQTYWQVLPLSPLSPGEGNSPYSSQSAFAGNELLISPENLVRDGWIEPGAVAPAPQPSPDRVDYGSAIAYKSVILQLAFEKFMQRGGGSDYERFCVESSGWLPDFALFAALREYFRGISWGDWPVEIRDREPTALDHYRAALSEEIEKRKFHQYLFFSQWLELKAYAEQRGIEIIGDMPIYTSYQSADVWAHHDIFKLDDNKRRIFISGVPPDYFSRTGQLWGNPVYDWNQNRATGFAWWIKRIEHSLKLFDFLRIDHFRGLVACWEVPAGETTAINGRWVDVPGDELFSRLRAANPELPIIAEDLGYITPDVREFIEKHGFPGMKVLMFAFGQGISDNPYAPHNHVKNSVIYTGTHDNNTVRGWYELEASPLEKENLDRYLGHEVKADEVHDELIRIVLMSVGDIAILPMQDILGLGAESRMNLPSTTHGNWEWRLRPDVLTPPLAKKLRDMTEIYGRKPGVN